MDKRLTGLSEKARNEISRLLRNTATSMRPYDGEEHADALEALAELVESAGREGE